MDSLAALYNDSLALLTDLYELTMAYGYWKLGLAEKEVAFHVTFRQNPFGGGYTIACGLNQVVEYLRRVRYEEADLNYLVGIQGNDGRPVFQPEFLDFLRNMRFRCTVDGVPEGTVAFPHEPLLRVTGPLLQCQLLETPLLNLVNFPTLIATKAARVCQSAQGDPVLEFGLRRAQGIDGGVTASRAAFVGGCVGTSNVLAGKLFGIPVSGTHAHSWVMLFDDELKAFRAYAGVMPNNCVFLVDTYDTLSGVHHAVEVAKELRRQGHEMVGVRLDSGDLAYLSLEAKRTLDAAGMGAAKIVGSGDLDENVIASLKDQHAAVNVWGVGTRLATAHDDPSLGGIYKLTAVRNDNGRWDYKIKLSEQTVKVSTPGILRVRRFLRDGEFMADAIYDEQIGIGDGCAIVDPADITRRKHIPAGTRYEEILVRVLDQGEPVYAAPSAHEARQRCQTQLGRLHSSIKRLLNPHQYPAGIEKRLHDLKTRMILEARGAEPNNESA